MKLGGIHHITAIAGEPQRNIEFYTEVLGLRLVKVTVNFDDPATYHLYYGDELGHPGTVLTFFPWPGGTKGRQGTGQLTSLAFSVPENALEFWMDHLKSNSVRFGKSRRFGGEILSFSDPDGLRLEIAAAGKAGEGWEGSAIPANKAITDFHGATLSEEGYELTASVLGKTLGFSFEGSEGNRYRYKVGGDFVDILCCPDSPRGIVSVGTVHHIAWRTPSDNEQLAWRKRIVSAGLNVTPVINRYYFHSIYFREPGGVLFEIATEPPGFTIDEKPEELGTSFKLPPWLEGYRKEIEDALPQIKIPKVRR